MECVQVKHVNYSSCTYCEHTNATVVHTVARTSTAVPDSTDTVLLMCTVVRAQMQLMRLLARRGAALCQQGHYRVSLDDFKAALAFDVTSESLKADVGECIRQ
jgi:hypothetical protein